MSGTPREGEDIPPQEEGIDFLKVVAELDNMFKDTLIRLGDLDAASIAMGDLISDDSDESVIYREAYLWYGIHARGQRLQTEIREETLNTGTPQQKKPRGRPRRKQSEAETAANLAKGAKRLAGAYEGVSFYEMPLPLIGKNLGDANTDDLDKMINLYSGREVASRKKKEFYLALRNKLVASGKAIVRTGILPSELEFIRKSIME